MSQHDFEILTSDANTGVTFRAEVNAALQALASLSSGVGDPSKTYPYQIKIDTSQSPAVAYMRKADNSAWVRFGYINASGQLIIDNATDAINATNAINADKVDGYHASQTPTASTIPISGSSGKLDMGWLQASQTPTANTIPIADSSGKLASGWLPSTTGSGSGSAVFTSSGSWTVPQGVTSVLILAVGGGGGGGGVASSSGYKAAGGGLGGQIQFVKRTVSSGEQLTITIGSGGSGGSSSGGNGGTGGTTSVTGSVSGSLVSSSGGSGGGGISSSSSYYALSTVGVIGIISSFEYTEEGAVYTFMAVIGGNGQSVLGAGGRGGYYVKPHTNPSYNYNGGNASGYGCGGGGAAIGATSASGSGGAGTSGLVVIWY